MTLKAGMVCYLVAYRDAFAAFNGHVVTLENRRGRSDWYPEELAWYIAPSLESPLGHRLIGASRRHLLPISDPDQPVDVTSDTDEPVTA